MVKKTPIAILVWRDGQCVPGARIDREALAELDEGKLLEVFVYKPPTNKQQRFCHWLFRIGAENAREGGACWTAEGIKMACKVRFGWVDGMIVRKGQVAEWNFRSLAEMDEDQMKDFIDAVVTFIESEVAPGIDIEALKREAKERSNKRRW